LDRGNRKTKTGIVVSDKMQKTVVVRIERTYRHPLYKKVMKEFAKFKAHDESNQCKTGDLVEIMETRPISRDKRWRVVKVLGKGKLAVYDRPKKKEKEEELAPAPQGESI
jgi:small subunit ribosomal protein S17